MINPNDENSTLEKPYLLGSRCKSGSGSGESEKSKNLHGKSILSLIYIADENEEGVFR